MVKSSEESDEHPLDRQYRVLQCKLHPLDSSSHDYKVCHFLLTFIIMTMIKVMNSVVAQNVFIQPLILLI